MIDLRNIVIVTPLPLFGSVLGSVVEKIMPAYELEEFRSDRELTQELTEQELQFFDDPKSKIYYTSDIPPRVMVQAANIRLIIGHMDLLPFLVAEIGRRIGHAPTPYEQALYVESAFKAIYADIDYYVRFISRVWGDSRHNLTLTKLDSNPRNELNKLFSFLGQSADSQTITNLTSSLSEHIKANGLLDLEPGFDETFRRKLNQMYRAAVNNKSVNEVFD